MLVTVLAALVPILVQGAISLFSDNGREEEKRAWVTGLASDLQPLILKWDPTATPATITEIEDAVEIALNEALDALEGANSPDTAPAAPVPPVTPAAPATGTP